MTASAPLSRAGEHRRWGRTSTIRSTPFASRYRRNALGLCNERRAKWMRGLDLHRQKVVERGVARLCGRSGIAPGSHPVPSEGRLPSCAVASPEAQRNGTERQPGTATTTKGELHGSKHCEEASETDQMVRCSRRTEAITQRSSRWRSRHPDREAMPRDWDLSPWDQVMGRSFGGPVQDRRFDDLVDTQQERIRQACDRAPMKLSDRIAPPEIEPE